MQIAYSILHIVVGYAGNTVGDTRVSGTRFNMALPQFRNVGGSEAKIRIGSISCNQVCDPDTGLATGFQPGSDTIQLFSAEGQQTNALSYATYEYLYAKWKEQFFDPGWYQAELVAIGDDFGDCMDDCYVPFGNGFVVKAGNGRGVLPTITFNGEVKPTVTEIPGQTFSFGGNCTPVPITVGDIKCNQVCNPDSGLATGFQPGSDTIQFFTPEGQVYKALSYASYEYLYAKWKEQFFDPGWYEAELVGIGDDFGECYNNREVAAGEAFVYKTGNGRGVWPTITIPAAIKDAE